MSAESQTPEPSPPAPAQVVAPPVISPPAVPAEQAADLVWGFWLTLAFGMAVAGAMIAVQSLVLVGFVAVSTVVGHRPSVQSLQSDGLLLALATIGSAPVVVGLSALFARLRRGLPVKEYLALKPVTLKGLGFSFAALLGTYVVWEIAVNLFDLQETSESMMEAYRTARVLPLLWFAVVVAGPAAEECFFRGFLFQGLLHSRVGAKGAVVLTAALWAVIHVQYGPVEITFIFLLGIVIGCIRLKTGSLWPPFLVHAVSNLVATAELAWLDK